MTTEILTGLLVFITGLYAFVTYRILKANEKAVGVMKEQSQSMREQAAIMNEQVQAMRQQADALTRPYIAIKSFIVPGSKTIYLSISNIGKSAAENLKLELDRDFHRFGTRVASKNLSKYNVFQNQIECFPPEAQFVFSLAQGIHLFSEQADHTTTPLAFKIKALYSYSGRQVEETTVIDLAPYLNSEPDPEPIIDQLKEINKALRELKGK